MCITGQACEICIELNYTKTQKIYYFVYIKSHI